MKKFLEEFKEFISRGNVMDMAVGVIFGGINFDQLSVKLAGDAALNNCASHSRYFSDELDAQIFYPKENVCLFLALYVLKYSHG